MVAHPSPPSAVLCKRIQKNRPSKLDGFFVPFCGEGGIRTPGRFHVNSFQDCRNRPLYHLSNPICYTYSFKRSAKISIISQPTKSHAFNLKGAESTSKCNTRQNYNKSLKNSSFGVEKFSFSLGLLFIFSWTECMNSSVSSLKSVPFGMYCRISLLAFSMAPFCQKA